MLSYGQLSYEARKDAIGNKLIPFDSLTDTLKAAEEVGSQAVIAEFLRRTNITPPEGKAK